MPSDPQPIDVILVFFFFFFFCDSPSAIAEQMYVDPELLDELTKEQKEILFHKVGRRLVQSAAAAVLKRFL